MNFTQKYDKVYIGAVAGFILPLLIAAGAWIFSSGGTLSAYLKRLVEADIVTHIISLCVFPNLFLFLITNRLDMLLATRGILGATIFWAILVFAVKFML
jgi:hypothetical protein